MVILDRVKLFSSRVLSLALLGLLTIGASTNARADILLSSGTGGSQFEAESFDVQNAEQIRARAVGFTTVHDVLFQAGQKVSLRLGANNGSFSSGSYSLGIYGSVDVGGGAVPDLTAALVNFSTVNIAEGAGAWYDFAGSNVVDALLSANSTYFLVLKLETPFPPPGGAPILTWYSSNEAPADSSAVVFSGNFATKDAVGDIDPDSWTNTFSLNPIDNGNGTNLTFSLEGYSLEPQGVPEPTTCAALAVFGAAGAFAEFRRRRKKKAEEKSPAA